MESVAERPTVAAEPTPKQVVGASVRFLAVVAVALLLGSGGRSPTNALPRLAVGAALLFAFALTALELRIRLSRGRRHAELAGLPTRNLLAGWITMNGQRSENSRLDLFRQVFYDGREADSRVARFAILMALAAVIATAGIVADSTAVVIGAMLIAPLITPMMGMALGLVMGWQSKLMKATMLVGAGTTIAVGIGWLLPSLLNAAIVVETNTQIVSRSSPTLVDLVVAIAAGAAGSYALIRPDVASSLPGVAVAIALVPPLSVVGILLHAGEWSLATGAALLFATNLIAILITGGFVFLITGLAPLQRFNDAQDRFRVTLIAVGLLALVIVGALAANGAEIANDSLDGDIARATVTGWIGRSDLSVVSVALRDDLVSVVLVGVGEPPPAELLANDLSDRLGRSVALDLQWIPRNQIIISGG